MDKKYIWLFGENSGNTANNNSFYFWKEAVKESDEILKYFVLKKTKGAGKAGRAENKKGAILSTVRTVPLSFAQDKRVTE